MGIPLPAPLGAFSAGPGGDLADECERLVRPHYGVGLYGGEGSGHQRYRRGQVYGVAYAVACAHAVRVNSFPDRAIEMLDEWDETLGLPHAPESYSVEQRQQRIRGRCIEGEGANLAQIEAALIAGVGGDFFALTNNPVGFDPLTYLVDVDGAIGASDPRMDEIKRILWRLTPAHVSCWIQQTTAVPPVVAYRLGA